MRTKSYILMTALLIGVLLLGACGGGGSPTATPAPAAPAEAPAEPTEAPAEAPAEATEAPAEEAPAEEAPAEEATEAPAEEAEATEEVVAEEEVAEEEAAPAEAEGTAEPSEAEIAAQAATEGSLTIWADESRVEVLVELEEAFEAETGVQMNIIEKDFGSIRDDLKVRGPAGQGPDVLIGAHDWLGELVASGMLSEVSLGAKASEFEQAAVDAFSYDGKLYGMPYAVENVAFIYNTDLVPEAPATWDEVKELSQELIDGGNRYGFLIQENDPYHFYPIQTAFGGYVFGTNEDGSWNPQDVGIDSEGTIASFEWLDSMYEDGLLTRGSAINYDLLNTAFQNGDAAMMIGGPWTLTDLRASGVPYAIGAIPEGTQGGMPFLGVQGFMISAFSPNQLLAQTFLQEYLATPETMYALYEANLRPSAFIAANEQIEDEDLAAFAAVGANGQPMPNIPEMSAVWSSWGDAMQLISQGSETPEAALTNAAEQIRTAIGE